jgi:hypothetical protein
MTRPTGVAPRTLWRHARLATMAGASPWGWIEDGALVVEGERIAWVGANAALPAGLRLDAEHDLGGALVTPGPSSSCGCKAPPTRRSRAPAAASAPPSRPPARRATSSSSTARRHARGC